MSRTRRIYNGYVAMIRDYHYHPWRQDMNRVLCFEERGLHKWKRIESRRRRRFSGIQLRMTLMMEQTGQQYYTGRGSRIYDEWKVI